MYLPLETCVLQGWITFYREMGQKNISSLVDTERLHVSEKNIIYLSLG